MIVVKLEEHISQEEINILIKYAQMNHTVKRLVTLIKSVDSTVRCNAGNEDCWINASDIFYIESVDKHTYIYGEEAVYATELRLYQLLDDLAPAGFVQISKSCILNLAYLSSIRTLPSSKIEATLTNGEHVTMTRKFIPVIKSHLKERGLI